MAKRAPGKAPGGPHRQQGAIAQKGKGVVKVQKRPALPVKLGGGKGPVREWDKGKPGVGGGKPKLKANPGPVRKPGVPVATPGGQKGRHTILLQQTTGAAGTRTWNDFDSTAQVGPAITRRAASSPAWRPLIGHTRRRSTFSRRRTKRSFVSSTRQLHS